MAAALSNAFSLALLAALLLSPSVLATDYHYCGLSYEVSLGSDSDVNLEEKDNDYDVKVSEVKIEPFPIVKSKKTTFSLSASTDKVITGGNLQIDVVFWGFNVHSEAIDLCKETSCPVSTGNFVLTHHQTLPWFTPPGTYTLMMQILGADGKKMSCITFDFSIGFASSIAEI